MALTVPSLTSFLSARKVTQQRDKKREKGKRKEKAENGGKMRFPKHAGTRGRRRCCTYEMKVWEQERGGRKFCITIEMEREKFLPRN